mgnify:FL=1
MAGTSFADFGGRISKLQVFSMKKIDWSSIGLLLGAVIATPAAAQQLQNPAEAFGQRPAVSSFALSPSGNRVAYLGPGPGEETRAYVAGVSGGEASIFSISDGDPMELKWCRFVSEQRLVCSVTALMRAALQI